MILNKNSYCQIHQCEFFIPDKGKVYDDAENKYKKKSFLAYARYPISIGRV